MNKVVAIVVTYNRLAILKECINALIKQKDRCDIMIINNASTDETEKWCKSILINDNVLYFNTGENLGGAGGFYYGMKEAFDKGYEYMWIMDDDCIPRNDALSELVAVDKKLKGNYGWLSSLCYWKDGILCSMNIQMRSPYKRIRIEENDLISTKMASFVSLFIKRNIISQFGFPIKEFFIWTDDWEYTRRISLSVACYTVKNSIVFHKMKSNSVVNIANDSEDRLWRYSYFYRNDVVLYSREGLFGWIWVVAKDVWHSLQVILALKFDRLPIIWRGFYNGISFIQIVNQDNKS